MRLFLLLLPLVSASQYGELDSDMVSDIFGQQMEHHTYPAQERHPAQERQDSRCAILRPCVEGSGFHQYWKHYGTALECYLECKQFTFVFPFSEPRSTLCTFESSPHCGIDGKTYKNKCDATDVHGVGVACEGPCPCSSNANVCGFEGNLEGYNSCNSYKFVIEDSKVYIYRPPCLGDELEVNRGVWKGETVLQGMDVYPNGWGILKYSEKDHLNRDKFVGHMAGGVMEGYGNLFWKDGSLYSGQFLNNTKNGEGTLFYSNGDIFSGHWSEERKSGEGVYMFAKGGSYSGGFSSGVQEGNGTFELFAELFKGEYKGGQRKKGLYTMTNGDHYGGTFDYKQGRYEGDGTYTWACGKVYTGTFKNGKPDGHGVMTYPDTSSYDGNFQDGKFEGPGKFIWSSGSYYEGFFNNGEMLSTAGDYYLEDGGQYVGGSPTGLYYPDKDDTTVHYEAILAEGLIKYKVPEGTKGGPKGGPKVKKGGYGK